MKVNNDINYLSVYDMTKKIKIFLREVMDEEGDCNEGSLSMHYEEILVLLDKIDLLFDLHYKIFEVLYAKDN